MKRNVFSTAMPGLMLSLAAITLSPVSRLHADIFTRITEGPGGDYGNSRGILWGDYDNDGLIDLFVVQRGPGGSGPARHFLYHNEGGGTFTRVTSGPIAELLSDGRGAAWGDFDNDGILDLVLMNTGQRNSLFHREWTGPGGQVGRRFDGVARSLFAGEGQLPLAILHPGLQLRLAARLGHNEELVGRDIL